MKATHSGHCQWCGRLQKLPKGRLSKHGYTVKYGFFSGICRGSEYLPFEVSCDQVARYIREARQRLDDLTVFIRSLHDPVTNGKAWFQVSLASPRGRYSTPTRSWQLCDVRVEDRGTYLRFYRTGNTQWTPRSHSAIGEIVEVETEVQNYEHYTSVAHLCEKANKRYARWLQHEVESLTNYIAWQQARVDNWKPAALLPVTHQDKEGFQPVAPAY